MKGNQCRSRHPRFLSDDPRGSVSGAGWLSHSQIPHGIRTLLEDKHCFDNKECFVWVGGHLLAPIQSNPSHGTNPLTAPQCCNGVNMPGFSHLLSFARFPSNISFFNIFGNQGASIPFESEREMRCWKGFLLFNNQPLPHQLTKTIQVWLLKDCSTDDNKAEQCPPRYRMFSIWMM